MLKFENVSKVYRVVNRSQAVKSVNFDIQQGEFLVLIGPSGSGKSTTMKMINKMEPHYKWNDFYQRQRYQFV